MILGQSSGHGHQQKESQWPSAFAKAVVVAQSLVATAEMWGEKSRANK